MSAPLDGSHASPTRVFLVSAVRIYREGLSGLLERRPGVDLVGSAPTPRETAAQLRTMVARPDIVILDMTAPESLAAARELLDVTPSVRVLAIAVPDNQRDLLACLEAGVSGFVTPDGSIDDLVAALHSVARGELLCSPALAAALGRRVASLVRDRRPAPPILSLTAREQQIVRLVDDGMSNKQIASELQIEVSTVKNHVHHILEKLGVSRRSEAAARVRGLVGVVPRA
jgi:DNA-binding NarL/FixJ family response regulator